MKTIVSACISACFLAFSSAVFAEDAPANSAVSKPSSLAMGGQVIEIVLALGAILLLIWGVAWFVRRYSGIGPQGSQHIKTIAVMPVGTRERIAVVQIGERQIVVGITPNQISNLLELEQPLDISAQGGEFARKLQTLLHRTDNEAKGEANGVQKQT